MDCDAILPKGVIDDILDLFPFTLIPSRAQPRERQSAKASEARMRPDLVYSGFDISNGFLASASDHDCIHPVLILARDQNSTRSRVTSSVRITQYAFEAYPILRWDCWCPHIGNVDGENKCVIHHREGTNIIEFDQAKPHASGFDGYNVVLVIRVRVIIGYIQNDMACPGWGSSGVVCSWYWCNQAVSCSCVTVYRVIGVVE